jgi:hypothetical protein
MDIPRVAGKAGKIIDPSSVVRRLTINRNQDKGAQLTIEEYMTGKKAKKGELDKETGNWIKSNAAKGITREVISVETFNISEIQRTRISQTTLSSVAETEIEVRDEIHVHTEAGTKGSSTVEGTMAEKDGCFAGCCTKDFEEGLQVGKTQAEVAAEIDEAAMCGCCGSSAWKLTEQTTTTKGRKASTTQRAEPHESKNEDPFHLVNVHKIQFFLRDSAGPSTVDFTWRIQSIGETETDLKYSIAHELALPCQDATSTARTLANIIHYLNA